MPNEEKSNDSRFSNRTPVNALHSLRTQDGAQIVLTQESLYPFDSVVRFDVKASQAKDFTVSFRIPAWATGASISVNGRRVQAPATPGSFAALLRTWSTGDRVELELPMTRRLKQSIASADRRASSWTAGIVCRRRHATSSNTRGRWLPTEWTSEAGK